MFSNLHDLNPELFPSCSGNALSRSPHTKSTSNNRQCSQSPFQRDAGMQLFRRHRCVFGSLFYFNRGEIGNIVFYSPLAPLESLLSFGIFMKNYFMLTYICCLFSPSVTRSRFSFIWRGLNCNSLCAQVSLSQLSRDWNTGVWWERCSERKPHDLLLWRALKKGGTGGGWCGGKEKRRQEKQAEL